MSLEEELEHAHAAEVSALELAVAMRARIDQLERSLAEAVLAATAALELPDDDLARARRRYRALEAAARQLVDNP